jgi:alkyl hydroperoxide reductase subunit AhpC
VVLQYPIIADEDKVVANLYDDSSKADETFTVRSVFYRIDKK